MKLTQHEILHILRNPSGHSEESVRAARQQGADLIESLQAAYTNMREWAEANGVDTVARNITTLADLKDRRERLRSAAEKVAYTYFCECDVGPERVRAHDIYTNLRLANRVE